MPCWFDGRTVLVVQTRLVAEQRKRRMPGVQRHVSILGVTREGYPTRWLFVGHRFVGGFPLLSWRFRKTRDVLRKRGVAKFDEQIRRVGVRKNRLDSRADNGFDGEDTAGD